MYRRVAVVTDSTACLPTGPTLPALRDDEAILLTDRPGVTLVLNRCAHLMCNRLGLLLRQEGFVRYLMLRAVTDLWGPRRSCGAACAPRSNCPKWTDRRWCGTPGPS